MTPDEISKFQSTHVDFEGKPLGEDGVIGPRTRWALYLAEHQASRQAVVLRAQQKIGVHEEPMGSNRGAEIDFWLDRCGVPVPKDPTVPMPQNAWCAAFASWCVSAAIEVRLAAVHDWVKTFKQIGYDDLLPGDFGYLLHPDGKGHIWMVIGREGGQTLNIEGNSNNAVRVTTRPVMNYLRVIAPPVVPGIPPGVQPADEATR